MKGQQRIEGHDFVKTLKNHSKNDKFSNYDSTEFSLRKPQNHNFFSLVPLYLWISTLKSHFSTKLTWNFVLHSLIVDINLKKTEISWISGNFLFLSFKFMQVIFTYFCKVFTFFCNKPKNMPFFDSQSFILHDFNQNWFLEKIDIFSSENLVIKNS